MGATIKIAILAQAAKAKAELQSLGETAQGVGDKVKGGLSNLAGLAKAGLAGAGVAAGAALMGGITNAIDQGQVSAKLGAQLGLTKEESAKVGKIAGKVYADNYGESFGQVNEAIKGVFQNIGEGNAKWTQDITSKVLTVANTFDQDLGGTTRAVGQLLRTGLAKDANEALDVITIGLQNGADKAGDLLDTFNEYGTQFRKVGLSGAEMTGILSQGLKAGARDADVVADAIKEFSIRAVDGSKTTSQGFQQLGLNAKQMASDIASGGPKANAALDTTLDRLRAVKDPVERAQIAVKLFGTQAEDLGDALFALDPSTAVQGLGDVAGAAQRVGDAMGESAGAKVEKFKRSLSQGFTEAVGGAIGFLEKLGEKVGPFFNDIGKQLGPVFNDIGTKLLPPLRDLWNTVQTQLVPAFKEFLTAIQPIVSWLVEKLAPIVTTVFEGMINNIKNALNIISGVIKVVTGLISGDWSKAWEGIKQIFSGVWDSIKNVLNTVWGVIKGLFSTNIDAIVNIASTLSGRIRSAISNLLGMLSDVVSSAWNKVKELFNSGISNAVSAASSLGSRVKSGIGNLGSLLYSAGQQIIEGLIRGIRDMAGRAVDAARGVVGDAINGAKRLLGIASPSKVFRQIGKFAGLGLAMGLEDGQTVVQKAADNLVKIPTQRAGELSTAMRIDVAGTNSAASAKAQPVVLELNSSGSRIDDFLLEMLRGSIRAKGGDVQVVLGR